MLFWTLFRFFVLVNFAISIVVLVSVFQHHRNHNQRKKRQKQYPSSDRLPSITVVIPAYNEELTIARCLDSVYATKYKNLFVIVVSDGSSDKTNSILRRYKRDHSLLSLRLIALRNNRGKGGAMNYAIKKYVSSKLTMIVDADVTLAKDSLEKVTDHFKDKQVIGLATNVRISEDKAILSIIQRIEFMVGFFHKKFFDATRSEFIIGGQGSCYRTIAIQRAGYFPDNMQTEDIALSINILKTADQGEKIRFGSDVLVYTESVSTFKDLLKQRYRWKFGALQALIQNKDIMFSRDKKYSKFMTWYRIPNVLLSELFLLFEPIALLFFVSIAIITKSPIIFLGTWLTFSMYTGAIVISDHNLSLKKRIRLSLYVPLLYPAFYVFNYINIHNMIRCAVNWRGLFGINDVSGGWTPPARTGAQKLS